MKVILDTQELLQAITDYLVKRGFELKDSKYYVYDDNGNSSKNPYVKITEVTAPIKDGPYR